MTILMTGNGKTFCTMMIDYIHLIQSRTNVFGDNIAEVLKIDLTELEYTLSLTIEYATKYRYY